MIESKFVFFGGRLIVFMDRLEALLQIGTTKMYLVQLVHDVYYRATRSRVPRMLRTQGLRFV